MFCLMTSVWYLMMRPARRQIQQAQRNGITEEGTTPTPLEDTLNSKVGVRIQLRQAAEQGDWKPIQKWLAEGNSLNTPIDTRTLLMIAAQNGHLDLMRQLYLKGSNVDARDPHGNTALFYAARYGQTEALRFLCEHGADLQAQNSLKLNALDMARMGKHEDAIALLKGHGGHYNLLQTIQLRDRQAFKFELDHGVDVNALYPPMKSPAGIKPNNGGIIFAYLPQQLPRTIASGGGGPQFAVDQSDVSELDYRSPLVGAVQTNQLDFAEQLIRHGARLDQQSEFEGTALMYAAYSGNLAGVRLLLRHGARTDPVVNRQFDALYYARHSVTARNRAEIVTLLQQHAGAKPK
jgi:ankyrin repeat protein